MGYLFVASLSFGFGHLVAFKSPPAVRIEEPPLDLTKLYDNLNVAGTQLKSQNGGMVAGQNTGLDCKGKIKGNVSSAAKVYHVPGGAFYERTNPEICFDNEQQAQAAGFRKSKK